MTPEELHEYRMRTREYTRNYLNRLKQEMGAEKFRERQRRHAAAGDQELRTLRRLRAVARKYGLSLEEYDAIFTAADYACVICGAKDSKLCLDHDHKSGTIREVLCDRCNLAIGLFGDDQWVVEKAASYLRKWNVG